MSYKLYETSFGRYIEYTYECNDHIIISIVSKFNYWQLWRSSVLCVKIRGRSLRCNKALVTRHLIVLVLGWAFSLEEGHFYSHCLNHCDMRRQQYNFLSQHIVLELPKCPANNLFFWVKSFFTAPTLPKYQNERSLI